MRNPDNFGPISAAGAIPIQGDFSEADKIAELAAKSGIVVKAADSDDVGLTAALIRGLKARKEQGKQLGVLLHVSGAGVFSLPPENDKVWDVSS